MRIKYKDENSIFVAEAYTVSKSKHIGNTTLLELDTNRGTIRFVCPSAEKANKILDILLKEGFVDITDLNGRYNTKTTVIKTERNIL